MVLLFHLKEINLTALKYQLTSRSKRFTKTDRTHCWQRYISWNDRIYTNISSLHHTALYKKSSLRKRKFVHSFLKRPVNQWLLLYVHPVNNDYKQNFFWHRFSEQNREKNSLIIYVVLIHFPNCLIQDLPMSSRSFSRMIWIILKNIWNVIFCRMIFIKTFVYTLNTFIYFTEENMSVKETNYTTKLKFLKAS